MFSDVSRWRVQRDRRRQRQARYAEQAERARRLRAVWPEAFGRLSDADVLRAVKAGVQQVQPMPPFGSRLWQRHAAGKRGQKALRARLAAVGMTPRDFYSWMGRRSHGAMEPSPFLDPPKRPARPAASVASAPLRTNAAPSTARRQLCTSPMPPKRQPGDPDWLVRR